MEIEELLKTLLNDTKYTETRSLVDLIGFAAEQHLDALAVANEGKQTFYLAFLHGEPEGAIYSDRNGTLYGDSAVVRIQSSSRFTLNEVNADIIEALVMGCRIFKKSHLTQNSTAAIQEIGRKSEGLGTITLSVQKDKKTQNGIRVSLRDKGKIVGSDITTSDGEVGFRVMHGAYTCLVQDKDQRVVSFQITFDTAHPHIVLDL
ncbi:MAG: hypothetical protein LUQ31_04260 [Methanoregula sp.]|nr:hypothetical protein [Methanoregula sp.]